jgi:hypothetical protein
MTVEYLRFALSTMPDDAEVTVYCTNEFEDERNPHEIETFTVPAGQNEIRLHIDYLLN